ncbi:hypothetical protein CKL83_02005 [Bacillus anthracis]|uniref:Uncharacterized protein n=4 Tax=Bacillus cereus group TaxID=86661 RepID=Q81LI4_BACAN|nr:hypothetical protein BA_4635 [Bacillus anthracis str. Ames]AAT33757.1 hypothetical protein GBAA_4635 [Bacillus anthracis str. 'Ames Ancestor']APT27904.1 hypothetical protein BVB96_23400 [Bacillus anthracis]ARZ64505.1 hypothetical protein B7P25_22890 [Bacillus thuringiensis]EDR17785.1 hypothetical protein BAC_4630 [Bacillus anthracis str. A0488]EDR86722.1 hypothetical protein BAQ_4660 [Bacillus anthracis str. A0193]EDR90883.1 hypothetical protein BAH_4686 [Bacillus anthracis str. A0442]EDS
MFCSFIPLFGFLFLGLIAVSVMYNSLINMEQ